MSTTPLGPPGRGGDDNNALKRKRRPYDEALAMVQQRTSEPDERPRKLAARRGYNRNILNREPWFYGFLSRAEGPPGGPWYLRFECIDKQWMDDVVRDEMPDAYRGTLQRFLQGQPFPQAFAAANRAEKVALTEVYLWYVDRLVVEPRPLRGTIECFVDEAWRNQRHIQPFELQHWFEVAFVDRDDQPEQNNGVFVQSLDSGQAEQAVLGDVGLLQLLGEPSQGILRALNFPNIELADGPAPPGGDPEIGMGEKGAEQPGEAEDGNGDVVMHLRQALGARAAELWAQLLGGLRSGLAALTGLRRELRWSFESLWQESLSVSGCGAAALGPGLRPGLCTEQLRRPPPDRQPWVAYAGGPANAMAPAAAPAHQPFVGILNVGQGNTNLLVDGNWETQAFFDFGEARFGIHLPAALPTLCFCHRPTVILSHWDEDHHKASARYPGSYAMRWIVPQQGNSATGSTQHGMVRQAGGSYLIWPDNAGASHLIFDWGYLERCDGVPMNGNGLAAFVCVREGVAPVAPAAAPSPNPLQPQVWGAANERGLLAVAAVNAVGPPALTAQVARAVASALACSTWGTAMRTAVPGGFAATIAARAITAATAAAAQPQPALIVPTPAAVTASVAALAFPGLAGENLTNARAAVANAAWAALMSAAIPGANGVVRGQCAAVVNLPAAPQFPHLGGAPVLNNWRAGVCNAVLGWAAAPVLQAGPAPADATESFVLLNGDANFNHVPSMRRPLATAPRVLGMTAMHHGSMIEEGELLAYENIPWAPGSAGAQAATAAHPMATITNRVLLAAASGAAPAPAVLAGRVMRAAAAAGNTIHQLHAVVANQALMTASPRIQLQLAFAAGTAAAACEAGGDADIVGLSAMAAVWMEEELIGSLALTDEMTRLLGIARGGVAPVAADARLTGYFSNSKLGALLLALGGPGAAVTALTPANALARATAACVHLVQYPAYTPLLGALANAAVTHWNANAGMNAAVLLQNGFAPVSGYPTNANEMIRAAIQFAAIAAAARIMPFSEQTLLSSIRAVATGRSDQAVTAALAPVATQIAYSYGIESPGSPRPGRHTYPAPTLGGYGHPHPLALQNYVARGWTRRFNTSLFAGGSNQPDGVSPMGHVALCWDNPADAAVAAGVIAYECPACGNALNFNC